MRETRTSGSVGAPGRHRPGATWPPRRAASHGRPSPLAVLGRHGARRPRSRTRASEPPPRRDRREASFTGVEPAVCSGLRGARQASTLPFWARGRECRGSRPWNTPSGRELSLTPARWVALPVRRWAAPRCAGRRPASGWWCRPCWREGNQIGGSRTRRGFRRRRRCWSSGSSCCRPRRTAPPRRASSCSCCSWDCFLCGSRFLRRLVRR